MTLEKQVEQEMINIYTTAKKKSAAIMLPVSSNWSAPKGALLRQSS